MHPRELFEAHTETVWNRGDLDAVEDFIAEGYVEHDPSIRDSVEGPAAYRENVDAFRSAFPDFEVENTHLLVDGDTIVARQRFTGTHKGPFEGVEPTGNAIESTSIVICRIAGNKIAETWVETDMVRLYDQLGVELP